jgi:hypothetical protein
MDLAKQKLTDPLTYAPLGVAALTGAFDDPYEYEEPAARPPVDTGFGDYRIVVEMNVIQKQQKKFNHVC